MDYLLIQMLNGVQLGLLMFLLAAGLTLTFGIMDLVNLAHGSLYMMGAYLAWTLIGVTDSFFLGALLALPATFLLGVAVEAVVMRRLYARDHLDQVLATFGLILFFNELVAIVWGRAALFTTVPPALAGFVEIVPGIRYPAYRAVIILVGLAVALLLYVVVSRTRLGMLIRAGASNRTMLAALGVNVRLLYTVVFGFGAALAGLGGIMAGPIYTVLPGMGEEILIQVFVVIVIGGIGSIRGAFVAALLIGLVDTLGRSFATDLLKLAMPATSAVRVGPALASMLIYLLMAGVLVFRPAGLFPAARG